MGPLRCSGATPDHRLAGSMTVANISMLLLRVLDKLFPVQLHEWPKVLVLVSMATLWGISASISHVAAEGLFLSHLGVEYLPTLLLNASKEIMRHIPGLGPLMSALHTDSQAAVAPGWAADVGSQRAPGYPPAEWPRSSAADEE